jgi:hypothetical protein
MICLASVARPARTPIAPPAAGALNAQFVGEIIKVLRDEIDRSVRKG